MTKQLITKMTREDFSEDFSVTHADEDTLIVSALASAGDAIETIELCGFMEQHGFRLGFVVPDAREFQFRRVPQ